MGGLLRESLYLSLFDSKPFKLLLECLNFISDFLITIFSPGDTVLIGEAFY